MHTCCAARQRLQTSLIYQQKQACNRPLTTPSGRHDSSLLPCDWHVIRACSQSKCSAAHLVSCETNDLEQAATFSPTDSQEDAKSKCHSSPNFAKHEQQLDRKHVSHLSSFKAICSKKNRDQNSFAQKMTRVSDLDMVTKLCQACFKLPSTKEIFVCPTSNFHQNAKQLSFLVHQSFLPW